MFPEFFLDILRSSSYYKSTFYFYKYPLLLKVRSTKLTYFAKENPMHITNHAGQRMNQRGITKEMIELTLQYGATQDEVTTLSRDAAARLVAELQRQMKILKKLLDKGGLTVVTAFSDESVILEGGIILDETILITTYNCVPQKKSRKWQGKKNKFRPYNQTELVFRFHDGA
jgi:hypothetical protein